MLSSKNRSTEGANGDSSDDRIHVTFNREEIVLALANVSAAEAENQDGWIQFHFPGEEQVHVSTIGQNISIKYTFKAQYTATGTFKVAGRQLADFIKLLPQGKVEFQVELPHKIEVRSGRSVARFQLIQDQGFIDVMIPESGVSISIKGELLGRWIDSFKDFTLVDDTRFYTRGALLWAQKNPEGSGVFLHAVASDATRLARSSITEEVESLGFDDDKVIVPKRALEEISRVTTLNPGEPVMLRWDEERQFLVAQTGNYRLVAQCISGKYPPFDAAVPTVINAEIRVKTKLLLDALRRSLLFVDKGKTLKIQVKDGSLDVESLTPGIKEEQDSIDVECMPADALIESNYNGPLLSAILAGLPGEMVRFQWEHATSRPVKILGEPERGIDVFYLLVPMRY